MRPRRYAALIGQSFLMAVALFIAAPVPLQAVPMTDDPKGFQNIAWGSALGSRPDMEVTRNTQHVIEYRLKNTPPSFAGIPVESVRFSSVEEQFARVTIRYQGEETHKRLLSHLEREFGSIERLPGQMMRGLNQQYNWRGAESEINLTYRGSTERGFIFIDSRNLAPRFNDLLADTAE